MSDTSRPATAPVERGAADVEVEAVVILAEGDGRTVEFDRLDTTHRRDQWTEPTATPDVDGVDAIVELQEADVLVAPAGPRRRCVDESSMLLDPVARLEQRRPLEVGDRAVGRRPDVQHEMATLRDHLGQQRHDVDAGEMVLGPLGPVVDRTRTDRTTKHPRGVEDVVRRVVLEGTDQRRAGISTGAACSPPIVEQHRRIDRPDLVEEFVPRRRLVIVVAQALGPHEVRAVPLDEIQDLRTEHIGDVGRIGASGVVPVEQRTGGAEDDVVAFAGGGVLGNHVPARTGGEQRACGVRRIPPRPAVVVLGDEHAVPGTGVDHEAGPRLGVEVVERQQWGEIIESFDVSPAITVVREDLDHGMWVRSGVADLLAEMAPVPLDRLADR